MSRLASRKLWVTILASALVTIGQEYGLDLDPEQIISLGLMVVAYVTGQAVVDRSKVEAEVAAGVDRLKLEANTIINALNEELESVTVPSARWTPPDANTELHQG